jgi:hypothetical protein
MEGSIVGRGVEACGLTSLKLGPTRSFFGCMEFQACVSVGHRAQLLVQQAWLNVQ